MSEREEHTEPRVEETRSFEVDAARAEEDFERPGPSTDPDAKAVDMDPEDHLSRPDQPDFDPAEREPFDDPDTTLPTESDS